MTMQLEGKDDGDDGPAPDDECKRLLRWSLIEQKGSVMFCQCFLELVAVPVSLRAARVVSFPTARQVRWRRGRFRARGADGLVGLGAHRARMLFYGVRVSSPASINLSGQLPNQSIPFGRLKTQM